MIDVSILGYALLGLLARGAMTGYDLAQRMRVPVRYFWQAGHSQIYPELARLESRGMVSFEHVPQRSRPDKKVYSLTESGRDALTSWLSSPLQDSPTRDELVLRVYSMWLMAPTEALRLMRDQEQRHRDRLQEYEAYEPRLRNAPFGTPEFAVYATLRRGLGYEREYADWCAWLVRELERGISAMETISVNERPDHVPA